MTNQKMKDNSNTIALQAMTMLKNSNEIPAKMNSQNCNQLPNLLNSASVFPLSTPTPGFPLKQGLNSVEQIWQTKILADHFAQVFANISKNCTLPLQTQLHQLSNPSFNLSSANMSPLQQQLGANVNTYANANTGINKNQVGILSDLISKTQNQSQPVKPVAVTAQQQQQQQKVNIVNAKSRKRPRKRITKPKLCSVEGCTTQDKGGGFCAKHGGGRPCAANGCARRVAGTRFCSDHGGTRKRSCSHQGCTKGDQGGGFCAAHGGGRRCSEPECSKRAVGAGLCWKHGGGKRCNEPNCSRSPRRGGYCKYHGPSSNNKNNQAASSYAQQNRERSWSKGSDTSSSASSVSTTADAKSS
mmetsp:Transcript_10358/g.13470  ORF Transcript_10358/g.13470 Transcript_10358/m.13470 type:complete len:357 (-) Transcript_10358:193-1263(-)